MTIRHHVFVAAAFVALSVPGQAQHHSSAEPPATGRYGSVSLDNNGNAQAQPHFLRGLALLHNFEYRSAAKAFQEAQKADPGFVMAYWGEAMTHNYPLWAQQNTDKGRAVLAKLGPSKAARAAKVRSPREKQWLESVEALYGEGTKTERDDAYAERMRLLHEAQPADVDARAFRALSLMGLAHNGRDVPLYMRAAALLEEVLPSYPEHPGVLHYLIHAYDDPAHAALGERAAKRYAVVVPDAGHAQHMVSHIYLALGRWAEVEAANIQAMRVEHALDAAEGQSLSRCGHYIEWQAYAVMQAGRDASDLIRACRAEAVEELTKNADNSVLGDGRSSVTSWSDMAVRQGIESGRWPDDLSLPAGRYELARFNLVFAKLLSSRSDRAAAVSALADLKRSRGAIADALPKEMPDQRQLLPWIDRAVDQGEAIVLLATGKQSEGLEALRSAAKAEAALPVAFGPPILQKPSAELLGEILVAARQKEEAAAAFQAVLNAAPNRRLALLGMKELN